MTLAAMALLAGCMEPTPLADAPLAAAEPGTLFVADGTLRPVEELDGVTISKAENRTTYDVDALALLHPNTMEILLVQALENQTVSWSRTMEIHIPQPPPVQGPDVDSGLACLGSTSSAPSPGDFILGRALGQPAAWPADGDRITTGGWTAFSGPPGEFSSNGESDARLVKGEWLYIAAGTSQAFQDDLNSGDNTWQYTIHMPGEHRFVRVPSAPFYCAFGFRAVPGTDHTNLVAFDRYEGGSLDLNSIYGHTVAFCMWNQSPGPLTQANRARLLVDGKWADIDHETSISHSTATPAPFGVEVQQWDFDPFWVMVGVPQRLVPGAFGASDGWNCDGR